MLLSMTGVTGRWAGIRTCRDQGDFARLLVDISLTEVQADADPREEFWGHVVLTTLAAHFRKIVLVGAIATVARRSIWPIGCPRR